MSNREKNINISEIVPNEGQIKGLPANPRLIRDTRFESLKKSIEDAPDMLDYRKLCVYPYNGKYVILCGNMRYRACKEIGYKELPCYVLPEDTDVKRLREWVIKDNENFGQYDFDLLANEWDETELITWGVELPINNDTENPYTAKADIPQYEVQGELPLMSDCYNTDKAEELILEINNSNVTDVEKKFLIEAAKRHTVYNYQKIAEYYASATKEMQVLMERSALVIIDVNNAIANGYMELSERIKKIMNNG